MARAGKNRSGYEGVVVAAPVSVPYERYSPEPAHWWLARALSDLGKASGLGPGDIDGLCVSSFTLFPDTAAGLTQHFGLTPRWLDHVPTGGASGVISLRRAARAVQSGDASVVDVFELVINGQEIAPGYNELNDPLIQRARLEASPPEEPSPSPAAGAHSASSGPVPASTPTDGAARTAGVVSHDGAIDSSA